ncbi:hypothetical protein DQ384_21855 [Sphaerisporangium album]|uniref:Uncharacterized protein n=2 Tax=Sphaerisporangium album TaxID=509200 RepID=A0A367FHB1_9ACTN|nr:hypothetical protein DQ384_21855 [Sphaerisporangium album]
MAKEPSLSELARRLEDARRDIRDDIAEMRVQHDRDLQVIATRLDLFVTRDRYDAERSAVLDRVGRTEKDIERIRGNARWALGVALTAFIGPIAVAVIVWLV